MNYHLSDSVRGVSVGQYWEPGREESWQERGQSKEGRRTREVVEIKANRLQVEEGEIRRQREAEKRPTWEKKGEGSGQVRSGQGCIWTVGGSP